MRDGSRKDGQIPVENKRKWERILIKPKKDVSQFHNGRKKPEVLAPAGSFDALKAAVYAGADAIYMGGMQFGARAFAENFDEEQLLSAIDFAHLHGCRIYLTVNTLLKSKAF